MNPWWFYLTAPLEEKRLELAVIKDVSQVCLHLFGRFPSIGADAQQNSGALRTHRFYQADQNRVLPFYSGCQNNVPIVGRYFVTTTYAAILFLGTLL
jgi:hypothetical protein